MVVEVKRMKLVLWFIVFRCHMEWGKIKISGVTLHLGKVCFLKRVLRLLKIGYPILVHWDLHELEK